MLLKTLSLRITLLWVCQALHACMDVFVRLSRCSCFDQQLKIWTCNRLLCGKLSFFFLNSLLFSCKAINPFSTLPSLPLCHSFLLLVFIKLFLNFVYLFFPFWWGFALPSVSVPFCFLSFLSDSVCLSRQRTFVTLKTGPFMGIPLNLRIGTASVSYRKFAMCH